MDRKGLNKPDYIRGGNLPHYQDDASDGKVE